MKAVLNTAATAVVLSLLALQPAHADTTEACLQATFDVAATAEDKSPNEQQLDQIELQLTTIEELCDDKKFAEADKARKTLKDLIAGL